MTFSEEEIKIIYTYLARQWLHYDDDKELREIVVKMGWYLDIIEQVENDPEINADKE